MPLLLLLFLIIVCLPINWPEPLHPFGIEGSLLLTGGLMAMLLGFAWLSSRLVILQISRTPERRSVISRKYAFRRFLAFFVNIFVFLIALVLCGWGWAVRELLTFHDLYLPGAELVLVAPYFVVLLGSWTVYYDAEFALNQANPYREDKPFWSRWGYVQHMLRFHIIMAFLPVILMIVQAGVLRLFPELFESLWAKIAGLIAGISFFVFIPALLPLILNLRRMPAGPMRDRLEKTAKRLKVGYRDLYVWDTHFNMATAMVAGVVSRFRYIIFTDLLLASLTEDEIESVLGHEVGHVKHGHPVFYAAFLLLSLFSLGMVFHLFETSYIAKYFREDVLMVMSVILSGAYLFSVFGYLSRRCERQADIYGCKVVSCRESTSPRALPLERQGIETFIGALDRVEKINGIVRDSGRATPTGLLNRCTHLLQSLSIVLATWQHSTISKRIEFLKQMADDHSLEKRFQSRLFLLRCVMLLLPIGVAIAIVFITGWESLLEGI